MTSKYVPRRNHFSLANQIFILLQCLESIKYALKSHNYIDKKFYNIFSSQTHEQQVQRDVTLTS